MNVTKFAIKDNLLKQKKIYISLCSLIVISIIVGIIFVFFISDMDRELVVNELNSFFISLNNEEFNYIDGLFNSLLGNIVFCLAIFLLGISIVGIPIIVFMVFMRGFILGFSFVSIVYIYGFAGVPMAFFYVFPVHVIMLVISVLLSFYAIKFSARLFSGLFLKKEINYKLVMSKYLRVFFISLIVAIINSLLEVFISPLLMKLVVGLIV